MSNTATATSSSIIIGTVENGVIKLPEGVHLPDGTKVTLKQLPQEETRPTLAEQLAPFIGIGTNLPADLAINHDHYLHGAPKQEP